MDELHKIQTTLKTLVKTSGYTYADIAKKLNLSLPTVKRLLNHKDIQLSKLIEICRCINIDFFDLVEQSKGQNMKVHCFTLDQENILAKDFSHFKVFRFLLMGYSIDRLQKEMNLSKVDLSRLLKQFEKHKLIEMWPNDKIKILAQFPFQWIEKGPLEKSYSKKLLNKIQIEIEKHGFNRQSKASSTHCRIKELFLTKDEKMSFQSEVEHLLKKYSVLSSLHIKNKNTTSSVYSYIHLSGDFSWWDEV